MPRPLPLPVLICLVALTGCGAFGTGTRTSTSVAPDETSAPDAAAPDAAAAVPDVAPGTVLHFGELASVCGLAPEAMGRPVGEAGGFTLYDSDPSSVALRSHYITGLSDGCARQFSAALALFGDAETHEAVRYLPGAQERPYSATDLAYEAIKEQVCGVASGQPCGGRIGRLSRNMTFITVYETFGTNVDWSEILLHDGAVAAVSFEGG